MIPIPYFAVCTDAFGCIAVCVFVRMTFAFGLYCMCVVCGSVVGERRSVRGVELGGRWIGVEVWICDIWWLGCVEVCGWVGGWNVEAM